MGKGLDYQISEKYSNELNHIENILNQLEKKRVYEISRIKADGSLITNSIKLKEEIEDLLYKIQNGEDGINDKIKKEFNRFSI